MNKQQKGMLLFGVFIVMFGGCSENNELSSDSSKTNADVIMTSQNFCTEGKLWTGIESTEIRKTPFSYKYKETLSFRDMDAKRSTIKMSSSILIQGGIIMVLFLKRVPRFSSSVKIVKK